MPTVVPASILTLPGRSTQVLGIRHTMHSFREMENRGAAIRVDDPTPTSPVCVVQLWQLNLNTVS